MESIYFVLTWVCHRHCAHCCDERFRPYTGAELEQQVQLSSTNVPRIIDNFPDRLTYVDIREGLRVKRGRIILTGGEVLHPGIRDTVLFPAVQQLNRKYLGTGGVEIIVQTTGDLLTPAVIDEMLCQNVRGIAVSGLDAFHGGYEDSAIRQQQVRSLTRWFTQAGMIPWTPESARAGFLFTDSDPASEITSLWPRGRALQNELSRATLADNFCATKFGGMNFLARGFAGSEVSVDPDGSVYPCRLRTRLPLPGSLLSERLDDIIDFLQGNPVYEAINAGMPERMGIARGWTTEHFYEKSKVILSSGQQYRNLCVGCDKFHEEILRRKVQIQITGR